MMQENLFVAGSISTQEVFCRQSARRSIHRYSVFINSLMTTSEQEKQYCLRFPVALAATMCLYGNLQLQKKLKW